MKKVGNIMINRIAIMGAGSLGTILGAYLARAGKDVTLVDAYEEHVKALNANGAHVVGKADFVTPVKAVTANQMDGDYDLFIYMAKQTSNDVAIPQMVAHCGPDSIICCCQNGVPEMAVAKYWPAKQICGAPVGWGATFKGPGVSELTSDEDACTFHLGTYDGHEYAWLHDVKEVLECMCTTEMTTMLMTDRWTKVAINASFSGMSAVIGGTFGDVMDDEIGLRCLVEIAHETYLVTAAEGIPLGPFSGIDYNVDAAYTNEAERKKYQEKVLVVCAPHRALVASMLQDLRRGLKCEIAQIDGVVSELGDKHNIETPYTDMVIRIVQEIEQGVRTPCIENLKDFVALF